MNQEKFIITEDGLTINCRYIVAFYIRLASKEGNYDVMAYLLSKSMDVSESSQIVLIKEGFKSLQKANQYVKKLVRVKSYDERKLLECLQVDMVKIKMRHKQLEGDFSIICSRLDYNEEEKK